MIAVKGSQAGTKVVVRDSAVPLAMSLCRAADEGHSVASSWIWATAKRSGVMIAGIGTLIHSVGGRLTRRVFRAEASAATTAAAERGKLRSSDGAAHRRHPMRGAEFPVHPRTELQGFEDRSGVGEHGLHCLDGGTLRLFAQSAGECG